MEMKKRKQQLQEKAMSLNEIHTHGSRHMKATFKHLSPDRQRVIKYIINKMKKYNGAFFESQATTAKEVGVSIMTVRRTMEIAKQLGIFQTEKCLEKTLYGNKRQTTNNVILLPFTSKAIDVGEVEAVSEEKVVETEELDVVEEATNEAHSTSKEDEKDDSDPKDKEEKDIYALFLEYKAKGVSKNVFSRLLGEIRSSGSYRSLIAYLRGALNNVVKHRKYREEQASTSWEDIVHVVCQRLDVNGVCGI